MIGCALYFPAANALTVSFCTDDNCTVLAQEKTIKEIQTKNQTGGFTRQISCISDWVIPKNLRVIIESTDPDEKKYKVHLHVEVQSKELID